MTKLKSLLTIQDLSHSDFEQIFSLAHSFAEVNQREVKKLPTLRGRTIINLFLEPSTRTRTSFEIAAKRLGADAINMSASASATTKGESLVDTAETLNAMSADLIVLRHAYSGSAHVLDRHVSGAVINGGDGRHQHPSQTLLDIYTMSTELAQLKGKKVGIVGDIANSRVAGSLAPALARFGAEVIFIGPHTLMPAVPEVLGGRVETNFDDIISELDVVYLLRIQKERITTKAFPSLREYSMRFGLDAKRLGMLKADALIMHPGPVNRGVEICSEALADKRSRILEQVKNGVDIRMALLYFLLGGEAVESTH